MKNIIYSIIIASLFIASCDDFELANQGIALQDAPGYVAFDAPGDNAVMDDVEAVEDDSIVALTIEAPTGTLSDITIDFAFAGSAVFDVDFSVANASAAGGSIVLAYDQSSVDNFDNVDLVITLLTDGVADGDKILSITLENALGADGTTFAVGRGGTDFLKSANVIIADID